MHATTIDLDPRSLRDHLFDLGAAGAGVFLYTVLEEFAAYF